MSVDKQFQDGRPCVTVPSCRSLRGLMLWQTRRYRQAVDENRWYMSEQQHRYIPWKEAELDFCQHNTYGCAEQWRQEYCGDHCSERKTCMLAAFFLNPDHSAAA